MKQRLVLLCCVLIVALQIISWIHLSSSSSASHHQQDKVADYFKFKGKGEGVAFHSKQQQGNEGKVSGSEETYSSRMLGRLGSRPPNCQRKCGGCSPCVATQIPATSDQLGIQYTNYEPEGWKCKCGSTFFNP